MSDEKTSTASQLPYPVDRIDRLDNETSPSWQSQFLNAIFRLLPVRKQLASAAAVQARVRKLVRRPAAYGPGDLGRDVAVTLTNVSGWPVYHTAHRKNSKTDRYVFFLHGGGFFNEIVRAHWRFIAYLTRTAGVRCVVPIYPLAPFATAKDLVPGTGALLRRLIEDVAPAKVTVVGNSAGAGLGLAAAQWLRDHGHAQPNSLVLISPGLDASIPRPEQKTIAEVDPLQDIPGLIEAGRLYAGDLDVSHPFVSPLRGDMHGLAPMLVFSGTRDLLYPDSIDLADKARAAGTAIKLHFRRGQPHNYPGLPTPEGREARELILRVVLQET